MRYLVKFPTSVMKSPKTAFIDNFLIKSPIRSIEGIITCLSDHDGLLYIKVISSIEN